MTRWAQLETVLGQLSDSFGPLRMGLVEFDRRGLGQRTAVGAEAGWGAECLCSQLGYFSYFFSGGIEAPRSERNCRTSSSISAVM